MAVRERVEPHSVTRDTLIARFPLFTRAIEFAREGKTLHNKNFERAIT
jgi:hypothetical protein